MLEVELVGVHLPFSDLDVVLSLLLGTFDLVPLITGLYRELVRRDKRVLITTAKYFWEFLLLTSFPSLPASTVASSAECSSLCFIVHTTVFIFIWEFLKQECYRVGFNFKFRSSKCWILINFPFTIYTHLACSCPFPPVHSDFTSYLYFLSCRCVSYCSEAQILLKYLLSLQKSFAILWVSKYPHQHPHLSKGELLLSSKP